MARAKIIFLGARKLTDGSLTGMIEIPAGTDRHSLLSLEGECWPIKDLAEEANSVTMLRHIRSDMERILNKLEVL